ncbi:MAG TPA: hypothetical protein VFX65_03970 [Candidatus Limnocylindrales bacterium]|nr:hypothetical protein [Candidatus Limnocylindrales bacterium]
MPGKPDPADALGRARDEYLDASSNARQFNVLRFAELTIFITATGALMAGTFSRAAAPTTPEATLALKLAGIVVTAVFWILQERTMLYWRHFVARAVELESELGYRQYATRPKEGFMGGHRAVRLLFLLTGIFWVAAAFLIPTTG